MHRRVVQDIAGSRPREPVLPPKAHLVVVGSGLLAQSVCYAAAVVLDGPVQVLVTGRSQERVAQLCYIANARAALQGTEVRFHPMAVDIESADQVGLLIDRAQPQIIVIAASLQSPWEAMTAPSSWTDFVARAGFGVTLPLQAHIAIRIARAVAEHSPDTLLINGCFPDSTNPLLAALGLPVLCGFGNAATISASLQSHLAVLNQSPLQVLAHHVHLHHPPPGCPEVLAWHEGRLVEGVTELLAHQRSADGRTLNDVAAVSCTSIVQALLSGTDLDSNLPGPLGLPGGYPVNITDRSLNLRLPAAVTTSSAIAWNLRAAQFDGVYVSETACVHFADFASHALNYYLPQLSEGFPVEQITDACEQLCMLRSRLRSQGSC